MSRVIKADMLTSHHQERHCKIVWRILLAGLFFLTLLTVGVLFQSKKSQMADQLNVVARYSAEVLRSPLLLGEMEVVKHHLDGILHDYSLAGIKLQCTDGTALASYAAGKQTILQALPGEKALSFKFPLSLVFQHSSSVLAQQESLGFLSLYSIDEKSLVRDALIFFLVGLSLLYLVWRAPLPWLENTPAGHGPALGTGAPEKDSAEKNRSAEMKRLREERDRARASSQAKNDFLAHMNHEIRSSLNGVVGVLSLLLQSGLEAEHKRLVRAACRSADSLLLVVNDVLDFTKIDSGKIEFENIAFDLRETLEECVDLFTHSSRAKGIDLHCYIPPTLASRVKGDPLRLRQIVTNLLSNAVKFTETGEVNLLVEAAAGGDSRQQLRFTVKDTGIGLETAKQGLIFEKYTQADCSITRKYGGTGVGLNICKQLVERQGGEIGVESAPKRGASFWFTLDFDIVHGNGRILPWSSLAGKKILLFDPCQTCRSIVSNYLPESLVSARDADDFEEILTQLGQENEVGGPPDLILLAEELLGAYPETSFARIRAVYRRHIPRIFLLGNPGRIDSSAYSENIEIVCKPIGLAQLCKTLSNSSSLPVDNEDNGLETGPPPLSGRVLLVDDEKINRKVGAAILQKLGCHAEVAGRGNETLRKTAEENFDLVIMDVHMPEMSGIECTEKIRAREKRAGTQPLVIIALTGDDLEETREKCIAAGMHGFMSKPMQPAVMKEYLGRWLGASAKEEKEIIKEEQFVPADISSLAEFRSGNIWDRDLALSYLGGDGDLLNELVNLFLQQKDALLGFLEQAIQRNDTREISEAAHAIKGVVNHFGAEKCRGLAQAIETRAGRGEGENLGKYFIELQRATQELAEEMKETV